MLKDVAVASEGTVLAGKYRLEKRLGSGGFATVWRARNLFIDRPVALKILAAPVFRLPGAVDRFVREARLAAMELHPSVVRVEDMGRTEDGVPFLVMELLRGESLDRVLKRETTLSLETCLTIVRPVLEGLAAAHDKGIIHRDIKPGNIFLVAEGTPGPPARILDMGIAKNLHDPEKITHTGQLVGTPKYLAPEVMLEQSRDAWRPAVDVFSLGMVLFKMLTGKLPFDSARHTPRRCSSSSKWTTTNGSSSPAPTSQDLPWRARRSRRPSTPWSVDRPPCRGPGDTPTPGRCSPRSTPPWRGAASVGRRPTSGRSSGTRPSGGSRPTTSPRRCTSERPVSARALRASPC